MDIQSLRQQGHSVVVVHGGSGEADQLGRELRRPIRYLTSCSGQRSRYTDSPTMDTLTLAMLGRVKPQLLSELARLGVLPVGLSGMDGNLITATRTPAVKAWVDSELRVIRDDLTGRAAAVDVRLLRILLDHGYVPVVSPPVLAPDGQMLNTDADRLSAAIAAALRATWLIVLSNVPGLLRDPTDETSLVTAIPSGRIDDYIPFAVGRMRVKLIAGSEAVRAGVPHVILADGRHPSPVLTAQAGAGTAFISEEHQ